MFTKVYMTDGGHRSRMVNVRAESWAALREKCARVAKEWRTRVVFCRAVEGPKLPDGHGSLKIATMVRLENAELGDRAPVGKKKRKVYGKQSPIDRRGLGHL